MFTNDEMDALHEDVFGRMLKAGWLRSFMKTDGKGWHVEWTAPGAQRAVLLRGLYDSFGLAQDDRAPVAFCILAKGGRLPDGTALDVEPPAEVLGFVSDCFDELGFELHDSDLILVWFHVVNGWAPDAETKFKFE